MRCLNHCPEKAIEAAHGMAVFLWIIFSTANTMFIAFIIKSLNIRPEVLWWRITADIISIGGMILITTLLYRLVHYAMRLQPVKYLVRFTSLTSFPFWRRYRYLQNNKSNHTPVKDKTIS
jgi:hypothetical protein